MLRLKRLYLWGNKLTSIGGLDNCSELQVLWCNDNSISAIPASLAALAHLRELNLGRNRIGSIGATLESLSALEDLNLAGNRIGAFKDIVAAARLPSLKRFALRDPLYGDNPVCHLCNYTTYALFHLNHLHYLDTAAANEEAKQAVSATFLKKKMYYNMRVKNLKRIASAIVKVAETAKIEKLHTIDHALSLLLRAKGTVGSELDRLGASPAAAAAAPSPDHAEQLKKKLAFINHMVELRVRELAAVKDLFELVKNRVRQRVENDAARLMLEMETGGNIRLEEGKSADVWYSSCAELIQSRFQPVSSTSKVAIRRVARIHNRFLRTRFEDKVEEHSGETDGDSKRYLEYLFAQSDERYPDEVLRVTEEGFHSPDLYKSLGLDEAVLLGNSILPPDADKERAERAKAGGADGGAESGSAPSLGNYRLVPNARQILVSKVYLGKCTSAKEGHGTITSSSQFAGRLSPALQYGMAMSESSGAADAGAQSARRRKGAIVAADYRDFDSVYVTKVGDTKSRTWFVFDEALVLPEYLVEVDFLDGTDRGKDLLAKYADIVAEVERSSSTVDTPDISLLILPVLDMLDVLNRPFSLEADYETSHIKIGSMAPVIAAKSKTYLLSDDILQDATFGTAPAQAETLNFHGNAISTIENLAHFVHLKKLVLSFNEISKMDGLDALRQLEYLDLSFNVIKRIEGIKNIANLQKVLLNNNLIYRLEDINMLKKYAANARCICLRGNAISDVKGYRTLLLRRLPVLAVLDDVAVTEEERKSAMDDSSSMSDKMLIEGAFTRRDTCAHIWSYDRTLAGYAVVRDSPASPDVSQPATPNASAPGTPLGSPLSRRVLSTSSGSVLPGTPLTPSTSAVGTPMSDGRRAQAWQLAEDLDLSHRRIRKIQHMSRMKALRRVVFRDNEIIRLEGLENVPTIEELNLEENRIAVSWGLGFFLFNFLIFAKSQYFANLNLFSIFLTIPKFPLHFKNFHEIFENFNYFSPVPAPPSASKVSPT